MGELAVSGNVYICFSRKMPCKQGLLDISVCFFSYTSWRTRGESHPRLGAGAFVSTRVRDKDCVKNRVKRAKIVRFTLC